MCVPPSGGRNAAQRKWIGQQTQGVNSTRFATTRPRPHGARSAENKHREGTRQAEEWHAEPSLDFGYRHCNGVQRVTCAAGRRAQQHSRQNVRRGATMTCGPLVLSTATSERRAGSDGGYFVAATDMAATPATNCETPTDAILRESAE